MLSLVTLFSGGLLQILISLLVLSIIIYVVKLVLDMIPLPAPPRRSFGSF